MNDKKKLFCRTESTQIKHMRVALYNDLIVTSKDAVIKQLYETAWNEPL